MTEPRYIYIVRSDINDTIYGEYESPSDAIEYAHRMKDELTYIDKVEVIVNTEGDIVEYGDRETIWIYSDEDGDTGFEIEPEDNYWDHLAAMHAENEANKYDIGDTTWFESMDSLVEKLEENENMVECKECFDLFPKADCIKLDIGYICPTCSEAGKVFTVSDENTFKVDFPEYKKFNTVSKEADLSISAVENESISTSEEAIDFLVEDEKEAIAGYERAAEVIEASDVENKKEILDTFNHIIKEEEEHIEELTELVEIDGSEVPGEAAKEETSEEEVEEIEDPEIEELEEAFIVDPMTKDELYDRLVNKGESVELDVGDQGYSREEVGSFSDGGYYSNSTISIKFNNGKFGVTEFYMSESGAEKEGDWNFETESFDELWDEITDIFRPEDLVEHVNEEHPAIKSDQKLVGTDNAVVDCEVADVITHSEDEKPLDCKMKKKPLTKPLTESSIIKDSYEISAVSNLRWGWNKNDGFYVEKLRRPSTNVDLWNTEFRKVYASEAAAKQAFDRYVKQISSSSKILKEETHARYAKPEGDPRTAHANARKYADKEGKPFIYGYSNRAGKFFALEQPIKVTQDPMKAEKNFRAKYKNCNVIYVAYPTTSSFDEAVEMTAQELRDKFGTDDVDLINAGREPENRVALKEDAEEDDPGPVKMANTSGISGMDFETAIAKFGVKLED